MSPSVTVVPLASFRNRTPYPFCPGCGHGSILDQLNAALGRLALDPRRVAIVSDIGCSGLSDQYFDTQAFHGLHGRSLTYATGLKLARPELTMIVVMGDGGTGIGGAHLLAAARRNLDLTVLVFNNFNFGMTGGQHSGTTPTGAMTATTPAGHLERPLDLCATAAAAGASWVWRGTSFDADLGERIAEGICHPGFALLDVWEPCSAYFAPRNRLTRKAITELAARLGFATGLVRSVEVAEYGAACRAAAARAEPRRSVVAPRPIAPRFRSALDRRFRLVLTGAAGGRVGTAARLLARAAILSGLHAAQRSDYPVTVKTGYSLCEVVLAPEPIDDPSIAAADALLVLAPEGRKQAAAYLGALAPGARLFAVPGIEELASGGGFERIDPAGAPVRLGKEWIATAVGAAVALRLGLLPLEALRAAAGDEGESQAIGAALDAAAALATAG
ncbi:MAG TPA: thiamine pyrophosphate-dependent enzyme [Thermoanaerobaculia bacterium]|nr:thiamine pyrophosphate-dependent enzyme [Thermoanaerobaculia bacterium]